jgi:hypothetical protein
MGSVHARGDTFLTFGLKALTETNTSRLATGRLKEIIFMNMCVVITVTMAMLLMYFVVCDVIFITCVVL